MNPYPSYKESGVEWVGETPNHWDIKRIKYTSSFQLSGVDRITYETEINVSICHYPDVYNNESIFRRTKISKGTCTPQELDKFCLKLGDILITKDSESPSDIGVPCYVEENIENTVCGYHLGQYRISDKMFPKYVFRFLQSDFVQSYFETESNGITRFGLGKPSLENLELVIPPLQEQQQISNYLDHKTQQIDSLIEKTRQKVKLLKEQRISLINQVVTKGLNPDVEMKDSDVEWIGEIPSGWSILKLKYLCDITYGISPPDTTYNDEGIGSVLVNGPVEYSVSDFGYTRSLKWTTDPKKFSTSGSLLFCLRGSTTGRMNVTHQDLSIGRGVCSLNSLESQWFMIYSLMILRIHIQKLISGSTFPSVTKDDVDNYIICSPPIQEQQQIVEHLDKGTTKIDSTIGKETQRIKLLKEYRQSLISNVVTGKVDVRDEVIE